MEHREQDRQWSLNTGTNDFSSYSPATVFMFALSSFGGAMAFIPILLPNSELHKSTKIFHFLEAILAIVVTIICLSLVYYKRRTVQNGRWPVSINTEEYEDTEAGGKQTKYMLATIIVFGSFSIASSVVQIIVELQSPPREVVEILHCGLDILSLFSQMIFFYYYSRGRLPNIRGLHYSIALFIGIKVCSWIGVTFEPLWKTHVAGNDSAPEFDHLGVNPTLDFFDEFFETFQTEFQTIAVGVLFFIWHSIEKFNSQPPPAEQIPDQNAHANNEITPLLGELYQPDSDLGPGLEDNDSQSRGKLILIVVSATLSVAFVTAFTWNVFTSLEESIYVFRLITLAYFSFFNIIAIVTLYRLRSNQDTASPLFNSSEYIILFTACGESIYYFLRGCAAIGLINSPDTANETKSDHLIDEDRHNILLPWEPIAAHVTNSVAGVYLAYAVTAILNSWVQTMLLLVTRRKHARECDRNILILFAGLNFSEWLQIAILLAKTKRDLVPHYPVLTEFYGPESTRLIVLIFFPIMVLFRFHSAIVSVELVHET